MRHSATSKVFTDVETVMRTQPHQSSFCCKSPCSKTHSKKKKKKPLLGREGPRASRCKRPVKENSLRHHWQSLPEGGVTRPLRAAEHRLRLHGACNKFPKSPIWTRGHRSGDRTASGLALRAAPLRRTCRLALMHPVLLPRARATSRKSPHEPQRSEGRGALRC